MKTFVQPQFKKVSSLLFILIRRAVLILSRIRLNFDLPYLITKTRFGTVVRKVNGFSMELNLRKDTGISKDLFLYGKREHLSTDLLLRGDFIEKGSTVLDIGANIGYYALIESQLTGDSGVVYALEPVSRNNDNLKRNMELNDIKNIRVFKLAVGNENVESEIYVSKKGNISSFIYRSDSQFIGKERVQMVTVDDFVSEQGIFPRFIRMDVEGFEGKIIQGMAQTLKTKPKLLIEVHPHLMNISDLKEMFVQIENSGYTSAIVIKEKNMIWMNRNGDIRKALLFLTRHIGNGRSAVGMGSVKEMKIQELISSLEQRGSAFHVFLS